MCREKGPCASGNIFEAGFELLISTFVKMLSRKWKSNASGQLIYLCSFSSPVPQGGLLIKLRVTFAMEENCLYCLISQQPFDSQSKILDSMVRTIGATIHWKAIERYFTAVLLVFQFNPKLQTGYRETKSATVKYCSTAFQ